MADLVIGGAWQALDGNGDPLPGAKAYFYDTGTTNARTTYQDSGAVTPHADPVVADANGFFPEVFVTGGTAVKCVLKTSADVTVTTQDPCMRINVSSSASAVSFTPTAEIAQTNVQDAIEQVQTNLEAGSFTNVTVSGAATLASAVVSGNLTFGGTALTDITGADTKLVSGTAGTSGNLANWNVDGDLVDSTFAVVDEDDMVSDSATKVPTQQSVKAYVDTEIAAIPPGGWVNVGTDEPTSDVSALTVTGLSGFSKVRGFFAGEISVTATVSLQARVSAGTWREICTTGSFSGGATASCGGFFEISLFNDDTAGTLKIGYLIRSNDFGSSMNRSGAENFANDSVIAVGYSSRAEVWDEVRLLLSSGTWEGTSASERAYLKVEGQA